MIEYLKKLGSLREWAGDIVGVVCLFVMAWGVLFFGHALGG